jgi:hypothetical protein
MDRDREQFARGFRDTFAFVKAGLGAESTRSLWRSGAGSQAGARARSARVSRE